MARGFDQGCIEAFLAAHTDIKLFCDFNNKATTGNATVLAQDDWNDSEAMASQ